MVYLRSVISKRKTKVFYHNLINKYKTMACRQKYKELMHHLKGHCSKTGSDAKRYGWHTSCRTATPVANWRMAPPPVCVIDCALTHSV